MKINKEILEEVEKTLNSFEAIPKLQSNPYLFTRIKSAIETDSEFVKRRKVFSLKPVAIGLILLINILTGIFFLNNNTNTYSSDETVVQSLKQDYKITQTYNEFTSNN